MRRDDFDFGVAREEWERLHGRAAELIAGWLPTLPASAWRYAQAAVYRHLHNTGSGPYAADAITSAFAKVGNALGQPIEKLQEAAE